MTAEIIDGQAIAQEVRDELRPRVQALKARGVEPGIAFIDDKEGKPIAIDRIIGRRPILAAGNSDGDLQMVEWVTAGEGPRLGILVHHTDGAREWAYDRESHIGRLDKALDMASERDWSLVDMKRDWRVVFPYELAQ